MTTLRIGCSGWSYKDWRGPFYPDDMRQKRWLEFYASRFCTAGMRATQLPKAMPSVRKNAAVAHRAWRSRARKMTRRLGPGSSPAEMVLNSSRYRPARSHGH